MATVDLRTDRRERAIIEALDAAVRRDSAARLIDAVVARIERKLEDDPRALMAWEILSLSAYGVELPRAVRSSWVFILRAGAATGAERHPNSRQRMMSYRGAGDFPVWHDGAWRSNFLTSDASASLERRWLSIPVNAWHQSLKPRENWVVVSFHSVREDKLMEERGDPASPGDVKARRYLDDGE